MHKNDHIYFDLPKPIHEFEVKFKENAQLKVLIFDFF
jgi:hypothetical protein